MDAIRSLLQSMSFLRGNVLVLTITRILGQTARGMVFPYAPLFVLALGGQPEQVGVVNSLRPFLGLIMFPIAGYLTDRAGRVKLIAAGGYFSAMILLLYVLAPTWQVVALAGLLQGMMVIQFPPTSALLADSLSPTDRAKGIATMNSVSGLFAVGAPYLAGVIVDAYGDETGVRILYAVMAILYLVSTVINHRFLRETSQPRGEEIRLSDFPRVLRATYGGAGRMIRSWPACLRAIGVVVILGFTINAVSGAFWVVYATERIGLSGTQWGLILLFETLLMNLAYVPAGALADRFGRTGFIRGAFVIAALSIPFFPYVTGFWGALVLRCAVAVANAFFTPACSALTADTVPREMRGRVMAAIGQGTFLLGSPNGGTGGPGMGFLVTIPAVLGSLLGGYLYGLNPVYPWRFTILPLAICLVLAFRYLCDPEKAHA